jgi:Resolvase, N terminal domain
LVRRTASGPAYERVSAGLDCCRRPRHGKRMNELLVGYAPLSQSAKISPPSAHHPARGLHALEVGDDRIYVDQGLTGTNREQPGLRLALAACRAGDTFVVTKLDQLARSLPDARNILDELTRGNVKLSVGGSIHDPPIRSDGSWSTCWRWLRSSRADLIRLRAPTSVRCRLNAREYLAVQVFRCRRANEFAEPAT